MEIIKMAMLPKEYAKELEHFIKKEWEAPELRKNAAKDIINLSQRLGYYTLLLFDRTIESDIDYYDARGLAVYTNHGAILVHGIATERTGNNYGRELMNYLFRVAWKNKTEIQLQSVSTAMGFYERIGMKCINDYFGVYGLTYAELRDMLETKEVARERI